MHSQSPPPRPRCSFQNFRTRKNKKRYSPPNTPPTPTVVNNEPLRCGACLLNPQKDKCLLVKQRDGKWGFPKGSFEPVKDVSHEACMIREVREETGIHLAQHQYDLMYIVQRHKYNIFVLHMKQSESDIPICPEDKNEIEEVKWVSWKDFHLYALNYVTKHILYRTDMRIQLGWNLKRARSRSFYAQQVANQQNKENIPLVVPSLIVV